MKPEKTLTSPVNPDEAKGTQAITAIKKFAFGTIWGLFIVAIYWSYSLFFHSSIPLARGIIISLVFTITCGLITMKVGYEGLDRLINNLPL